MKKVLPKGIVKKAIQFFAALYVYERVVAPTADRVIAKAKGGANV